MFQTNIQDGLLSKSYIILRPTREGRIEAQLALIEP